MNRSVSEWSSDIGVVSGANAFKYGEAGYFSSAGATYCKPCPAGEFTDEAGQGSCSPASAGYPSGVE